MKSQAIKIKSLTYSIFSVFFVLYFLYIGEYKYSSVFILYSIFFISMLISNSRNSELLQKKLVTNAKHYLLNIGLLISWVIMFIIDLESINQAFVYIHYFLFAATTIVLGTLFNKLIR